MIINEKIKLTLKSSKHIKYFRELGYDCKLHDILEIYSIELPKGSNICINAKCDVCSDIVSVQMYKYNKNKEKHNIFTCCKKCSLVKTKLTNNEKYGCDNVFQSEQIKEKIKKDCIEKNGVEHHTQLIETINKRRMTNIEIYGHEHHLQNPEILKKQQISNLENFGDICVFSNKEKQIEINNTNEKLYGDKYVLNNPKIREKALNTKKLKLISKYKENAIYDINYKDGNYIGKCENGHIFKISRDTLYNRIKYKTILCTECNPNNGTSSGKEIELYNYIKSVYSGEILTSDRKILNGKELDIYLPDIQLAFEFNGLKWHSEEYKDKNYHLDKTNNCIDKGIHLIHIFEDQWDYKKDIVKSRINNLLGINVRKIYGRKCKVKKITDNKIIREFLLENHIQGFCPSSIKLGLFHNDELVSLMTFGKLRKVTGNKDIVGNFELLRFCNKLNSSVIGGASKLFKYFIRNFEYVEIVSYADKNWSNGNLYEKIGFWYDSTTKPNYYYIINHERKYRFNYRKDVLVKEGFDKNKSEHEIMIDRGYFRIYDTGNLKYKYTK